MKLAKYLFQDNTGKYVVGQPPSVPVYMVIVSFLVSKLVTSGTVHSLAEFVLAASIFLWAYLEIRFGESVFRRILGVAVMAALIFSRVQ